MIRFWSASRSEWCGQLWLGASNGLQHSKLHRDSSENIYAMVDGRKLFSIFPPEYTQRLKPDFGRRIEPLSVEVSMLSSISPSNLKMHPHHLSTDSISAQGKTLKASGVHKPCNSTLDFSKMACIHTDEVDETLQYPVPKPLQCILQPGQWLYLPAMWWHDVIALPVSSLLTEPLFDFSVTW